MVTSEIKGLINKPQFDMNVFETGVFVIVVNKSSNKSNLDYNFHKNCIVSKAEPLKIKVIFCDKEGEAEEVEIPVSDVINGYTEITVIKDY